MNFLKFLLAPFALLYHAITAMRNFLFDKGLIKSSKSIHFTVVVGNLAIGGTGKSPFIKYLLSLEVFKNPAVLSRGYGRETKGFLEVNHNSLSSQVGDEPKMLSQFGKVYVCEDRVYADSKISKHHDALLLDDGFQHRYLQANLSIIITSFQKPFIRDFVLPVGTLRESRNAIKRAQIVIVSKVPQNYNSSDLDLLKSSIHKYNKKCIVCFCQYINSEPINSKSEILKKGEKVLAFSGLGDNSKFEKYARENYEVVQFHPFRDHMKYSYEFISQILSANSEDIILTTAKDYVKIKDICPPKMLEKVFYTDTSVKFINGEDNFLQLLESNYKAHHSS